MSAHDVIIVGAGPAGIGAALRLRELGIRDVVVLDREGEAGGIPRHCGHLGFGWREFRTVMTGPRYAAALAARARKMDVRTATTVLDLASGAIRVTGSSGSSSLTGKRVLLATGVRETPRSARLVGGDRPAGVLTTGALQQFVYLQKGAPFDRPVIVGTELVSFSALLTCRHGGMRPVAMIERNDRATALWPAGPAANLLFGVPLFFGTRLLSIKGRDRVEAVLVERAGTESLIACDGVVFTGEFVPEGTLYAGGQFRRDHESGAPCVDQFWRTSSPAIFAAGNVVHPVETAGWCWRDGRAAAEAIAADLAGTLPAPSGPSVSCSSPLKYVYPQKVIPTDTPVTFHGRLTRPVRGNLVVKAGSRILASRYISSRPERRITLTVAPGDWLEKESIHFAVEEPA